MYYSSKYQSYMLCSISKTFNLICNKDIKLDRLYIRPKDSLPPATNGDFSLTEIDSNQNEWIKERPLLVRKSNQGIKYI